MVMAWVGAFAPGMWSPGVVAGIEDRVGDLVWKLGADGRVERRVVLVDIDEKSLAELGSWPWSRSMMADLSSRLAEAGARVQAYDVVFSDPRPRDAALQEAWSQSPTVIAQVFSLDPQATPAVGAAAGALMTPGCPAFAPHTYGIYGVAESLLAARPAVGHITPRVGSDGVVRLVPALVCHLGKAYASLALTTLWMAAQPDPAAVSGAGSSAAPDWVWHTAGPAPFPWGRAPHAWLTSASLPGLVVPLGRQGDLRVPYGLSRSALTSVSASDVLSGRADTRLLAGAIVIVGATAFGIGDTVATPLGAVASGLEVHAQTMAGLLDQRIPYTPVAWTTWVGVFWLGASLALIGVATHKRGVPAKRLPLIGLFLALVVVLAATLALLELGLWLPWFSLAAFSLLASILLATAEHALVRAQRERLTAHLGAYLPAPVAQRLMASDPSGSLELEQRDVCVLVAEVRNFSAFATHADPKEVASTLHGYCCLAVEVVERHGGVVDNVVGDRIVAIWAGTANGQAQALQAMAAARDLIRSTRPMLATRHPVTDVSPIQPLALGVGLEAGLAIVGSFGPTRRRAHAALGEPVSVASRIQQMTADLSIPVLAGPKLAAQLPGEDLEPLGEYLLEGLGKHYEIFAPVGWGDLAYVDAYWAASAASEPMKPHDTVAEWSRWGSSGARLESVVASFPPVTGALAALRRPSV